MKTLSKTGLLCAGVFFLAVVVGEGQSPTTSPQSPAPLPAESATPPAAEAETERIIVIGSNIPTAEEAGPNPIQTIDRAEIEKSGERTAEQLLRDLSIAGPQGVPSFNGANGVTKGASSVSLRGFDPSDTLVLIDGRRVAPYPLGAGGTQSFVDLNSIPRAAIQSIEILKDSASTIYGADAVAGVVNIKLRHNYRGAESTIEYGNSLDKDSGEFAASLLFGIGDAETNVAGVLNFYHRNSLFDRDRGFSNQAKPPSVSSSPFNLQLSREAVIAAGVPAADLPEGDTFYGHSPFSGNGLAPASAYTYSTSRTSLYNFEVDRGAIPDSERYGGFVNMEHRLFGDQMILYADTFYQNVKTSSTLAATPTGVFDQPGKPILAIPPRAPGPTLGGPTYEETGVSLGAFNPFNPFQQIISGASRGRLAEFPPRTFDNETDAFFSTVGLKGDRLFDGTWGYDAAFRFSEVGNTGEQTVVSATRFNRILNAADPIFDPASSQFIGTTVPYNPFGDYRVPIPANQLPINYATIHPKETDTSRLATLDLNIYTTELCKLPAGGVGFAVGGQFRRESLRQEPDALALSGDILGDSPATFTNAGRKTYAIYAEGDLPVFSSTYNLPGFHALDFTASVRYEEFLSNSSNVLVPKFGLLWQPFDESFTVRSTWGEGFHQPSLIELYGTPNQGLITVNDPATATQVTEVPYLIRSNPGLQPEDSRAFTAGIVYSPKFVPNLTITIDLFDIESKGRVNSFPNPNDILARALEGRSLFGEQVLRDEEGNLIAINGAYQNGGSQKARGADFGIQYQLETRVGTFTSLTQATYLDSFQFADTPDVPEKEFAGTGDQFFSSEANLRWKGTSRLDWTWKNFDIAATVNYRDGFHEHQSNGLIHYVKQTWFFDGQASYDFRFVAPVETRAVAGYSKGEALQSVASQTAANSQPAWQRLLHGTSITVGCNDIFGQDPPRSFLGYPSFAYDPTGRFVYLSVTKKF